ncbi:hypothetical protein MHU86_23243 [Fragilaria crotonensis]|nr:hypothetical protein MHU86_23243 [Fragilaria crotonensis]
MKKLSQILLATLIGCYAGIAHGSTSGIDCSSIEDTGLDPCPVGMYCDYNAIEYRYRCASNIDCTEYARGRVANPCPEGMICYPHMAFGDFSLSGQSQCVGYIDGYENKTCLFGYFCASGLACQKITNKCRTIKDFERENACIRETRTVMVDIKDDYQTTGVTTRSAKVADTLMVLDDFSTNSVENLGYKFACTEKGGKYVELHYNATCETTAVGGGSKKIAKIFVAVIRLRSGPVREHSELHLYHSATTCRRASKKTKGMAMATLGMKPVIQVQKSVGLVKEEKLMTFTGHDPARFTKACEVGGGVPYEADGRLACGISKYDVKKYPTCLWALCGGVSSSDAQAVIESQLHDRLVAAGQIKNKTSCKFSSALRLHASVASGAFLSMLFMTIGIMVL